MSLTFPPPKPTLPPNKAVLDRRNKYGYKVSTKLAENRKQRRAIEEYLYLTDKIVLPENRYLHREQRQDVYRCKEYGDRLAAKYENLATLYYALKEGMGIYAEFFNPETKQTKWQFEGYIFSKHRLDAVWNWRKSLKIRHRYATYLTTATDEQSRLLCQHYQPIHLTLTVPHTNGLFKGKRFYGDEVIQLFNLMRKHRIWKKYIYAGEYGLETTRSKDHGLHIHLHSLILQYPEYTVNEVRTAIAELWSRIVEQPALSHYETLFTYERDKNGKVIYERDKRGNVVYEHDREGKIIYERDKTGKVSAKKKKQKRYINPGVSDLKEYMDAVMECIKYHFKPGCLQKQDGQYDMELIMEILDNTKSKRLYSRFGAFYNVPELNFNRLQPTNDDTAVVIAEDAAEITTETVAEIDAETLSTESLAAKPITGIIDPFTLQPAIEGQYRRVLGYPSMFRYKSQDTDNPHEPYIIPALKKHFRYCPDGMSLNKILSIQAKGELSTGDYI